MIAAGYEPAKPVVAIVQKILTFQKFQVFPCENTWTCICFFFLNLKICTIIHASSDCSLGTYYESGIVLGGEGRVVNKTEILVPRPLRHSREVLRK